MNDLQKHPSNRITTKCPVCPAILGSRNPTTVFSAHCEECKATFTWHPKDEKPTALLDKHKAQRCGCHGCGR